MNFFKSNIIYFQPNISNTTQSVVLSLNSERVLICLKIGNWIFEEKQKSVKTAQNGTFQKKTFAVSLETINRIIVYAIKLKLFKKKYKPTNVSALR